jgi:hypothetical protein
VGDRFDVDANKRHEVWIGPEGCTYVIGEWFDARSVQQSTRYIAENGTVTGQSSRDMGILRLRSRRLLKHYSEQLFRCFLSLGISKDSRSWTLWGSLAVLTELPFERDRAAWSLAERFALSYHKVCCEHDLNMLESDA